jgi:hypothetical protein
MMELCNNKGPAQGVLESKLEAVGISCDTGARGNLEEGVLLLQVNHGRARSIMDTNGKMVNEVGPLL